MPAPARSRPNGHHRRCAMTPRHAALRLILLAAVVSVAACAGGATTGSGGADSPAPGPTVETPIRRPRAPSAVVAQEPV